MVEDDEGYKDDEDEEGNGDAPRMWGVALGHSFRNSRVGEPEKSNLTQSLA